MKIKALLYFVVAILLVSCVATKNKKYTFNQKYSATKIKEDIILLKQILEANHPSLYWHTPKDSINYYFTETLATITDSLTETQVKNKIAATIAHLKCGHTSVRFSKQFMALADKNKFPQFPLSIKTWADSLVVIGIYNLADSALQRGSVITSINGRKSKDIIDNMMQYISTDGNSINFKSQVLTNNFPAWYRNIFSVDSLFHIEYLDTLHQPKSITITSYNPKKDTAKSKIDTAKKNAIVKIKKITKKEKKATKLLAYRSFIIDTASSTAFIKLATFSKGNLKHFFRKSFKTTRQMHLKNMVFDIRENGGGRVDNFLNLTNYLKKDSYKIGDTVAAISRAYHFKKYIQGWLPYWVLAKLTSTKMEDGLFHNSTYETELFSPKIKNHFDGNIYIIQGGYTFSAATMFAATLKGQQNVTLVGEETGGGYYGNTAMHIPAIILPNTKLKVSLPMYRLVMDKTRPKGRGIMPDIYISPSADAIKKGIDLKMMEVKKLIKERSN